ncbi:ENV2 protein, partial [Hemiprocne comata]|nr:ENV2 protein [Hemiprocne comata]
DPLWDIMEASYLALNNTKPNLTKECWLCFNVRPPYYEAVGQSDRIKWSNGTNTSECLWSEDKQNTQGMTLQHVMGKGRCIG